MRGIVIGRISSSLLFFLVLVSCWAARALAIFPHRRRTQPTHTHATVSPMDQTKVDAIHPGGTSLYDADTWRTTPAGASYLDTLPHELVSLVATHVAHSDVGALNSLASTLAHGQRQAVAATPISWPWLVRGKTAPLDRTSRLAEALGVRGINEIADRARHCVLLAYVDWVTADVPADVPVARMAAAALVSKAESASDVAHLCRLVLGRAEACRSQDFASETPISGLGAPGAGTGARPARIIHRLDSTILCRITKEHGETPVGSALDGRSVRRWMDDAIDTAAKRRYPGAFVVAPEMMPRFSDLFAVDAACVAIRHDYEEIYLAGRLRPLW
nr:hypothetical protein [Pandoravirus massiliensis]